MTHISLNTPIQMSNIFGDKKSDPLPSISFDTLKQIFTISYISFKKNLKSHYKCYYNDSFSCVVSHRLDGPACEWANGDKEWWVNAQRHRLDGPAIQKHNGDNQWWINGFRLSPEKERIINTWWKTR